MTVRLLTTLMLATSFIAAQTAGCADTAAALNREIAHYYINPLRLIELSDGTHFIIRQPHAYANEPQAMTAVLVDPQSGESLQSFTARQALPVPADMLDGTVGQLYGAALLPPVDGKKRMVVSAGWQDTKRELRFALLIVRESSGALWRPVGRIDGIGRASDLAVTDDGSILAVTSDPAGGRIPHPALTLVSPDGQILGTYFDRPAGIDGGRLFVRGRVQAVGGDRFAFHDGLSDVIETFRIDRITHRLEDRRSIHVPALHEEGSVQHVRGWHVNADGSVTVIRTERSSDKGVVNLVTQWSEQGALQNEWSEGPVAGVFWSHDDLRLVRRARDETYLEPAITSATGRSSSPRQ